MAIGGTAGTQPIQDERIMAAISHASIITSGFGIVAAAIIWLMQREKSSYVRFQALQALAYQFIGMLLTLLLWACWGCFYGLSFIPMIQNPQAYEDTPPPIFWISLASIAIPLVIMGLFWLYGLYGGLRTLQGRAFQYFVLGSMVQRYVCSE
jgi:uncharacterized Tic20 family protein